MLGVMRARDASPSPAKAWRSRLRLRSQAQGIRRNRQRHPARAETPRERYGNPYAPTFTAPRSMDAGRPRTRRGASAEQGSRLPFRSRDVPPSVYAVRPSSSQRLSARMGSIRCYTSGSSSMASSGTRPHVLSQGTLDRRYAERSALVARRSARDQTRLLCIFPCAAR